MARSNPGHLLFTRLSVLAFEHRHLPHAVHPIPEHAILAQNMNSVQFAGTILHVFWFSVDFPI